MDVGCGTGGFTRRLRDVHPDWDVRGLEPSAKAVEVARGRGCLVDTGTFESLPADDASLDMLVALDVLEHCKDDRKAIAEAVRVLKPGGLFVVTVPAMPSLWSSHDEDNAHYRRYTRKTLLAPFAGQDLELVRLTSFNTLLLPVAYVSRWIARTTGSKKALGVDLPPAPLNSALRALFSVEVELVRHVDLPVGMSVLAVFRKGEGGLVDAESKRVTSELSADQ